MHIIPIYFDLFCGDALHKESRILHWEEIFFEDQQINRSKKEYNKEGEEANFRDGQYLVSGVDKREKS